MLVNTQIIEGAEPELRDTKGATMLLRATQGVVRGSHGTRGGLVARIIFNCVLGISVQMVLSRHFGGQLLSCQW